MCVCVCLAIPFFRNRLLSQFCQFYVNLLSCQKGRRDNKLSEKSIKSRVGRLFALSAAAASSSRCLYRTLAISFIAAKKKKQNKNKEKKKHFHWRSASPRDTKIFHCIWHFLCPALTAPLSLLLAPKIVLSLARNFLLSLCLDLSCLCSLLVLQFKHLNSTQLPVCRVPIPQHTQTALRPINSLSLLLSCSLKAAASSVCSRVAALECNRAAFVADAAAAAGVWILCTVFYFILFWSLSSCSWSCCSSLRLLSYL